MIADFGGYLFLLTFAHFIVDWGFQSHWEAMNKATNWKVRARHCTVYLVGMLLVSYWMGITSTLELGFCVVALWLSHFLIDTYLPVYVWARYVRRPPQMLNNLRDVNLDSRTGELAVSGKMLRDFKSFAETPIGLFLVIAIDQAWHIFFFVPIAALLSGREVALVFGSTLVGFLILFGVVFFGYYQLKKGDKKVASANPNTLQKFPVGTPTPTTSKPDVLGGADS